MPGIHGRNTIGEFIKIGCQKIVLNNLQTDNFKIINIKY